MSTAIFTINNHGKLKNVGRPFKSYEHDIVKQCADLFLADGSRQYSFRARKLGGGDSGYEWNSHNIIVYAADTPYAHAALLRLLNLADCDKVDGFCFVVHELHNSNSGLKGVFDSRRELEKYLASLPQDDADDTYVRVVPFNHIF